MLGDRLATTVARCAGESPWEMWSLLTLETRTLNEDVKPLGPPWSVCAG